MINQSRKRRGSEEFLDGVETDQTHTVMWMRQLLQDQGQDRIDEARQLRIRSRQSKGRLLKTEARNLTPRQGSQKSSTHTGHI